jgi:hypothetical protein
VVEFFKNIIIEAFPAKVKFWDKEAGLTSIFKQLESRFTSRLNSSKEKETK